MLKSNRDDTARSLPTLAVYAADICPSIGLNRAVMVVGGERFTDDEQGIWEGKVALSGRVVNRIPVDTILRMWYYLKRRAFC